MIMNLKGTVREIDFQKLGKVRNIKYGNRKEVLFYHWQENVLQIWIHNNLL